MVCTEVDALLDCALDGQGAISTPRQKTTALVKLICLQTRLWSFSYGILIPSVCVVPFGRDQPEVARRVEVARAGARLPASRLNPRRLREAVREAMTMRDGAERIAQAFAATHADSAEADALEKISLKEAVR